MKSVMFLIFVVMLMTTGVFGAGGTISGSGTELDPYLIQDFDDFKAFAADSNYWSAGVHTKLMADIDLDPALDGRQTYTTAVIAPDTDNTDGGFFDPQFCGFFNGNGHTISNLTIDSSGANNTDLGLFGRSRSDSEINNLVVSDVKVIGGDDSIFVGGLCGLNSGTITNSYSIGSIAGGDDSQHYGGLCGYNNGSGEIINCFAAGTVTGDSNLGGLCGQNYGTITDCNANSSVSGTGWTQGGLCGSSSGLISGCYATGTVTGNTYAGGLCGDNSGTVIKCYASVTVNALNGWDHVGGLCGQNTDIIINCYASGSITGKGNSNDLGGLCGLNYGLISNCYSTSSVTSGTGSETLGGLCGENSFGTISNCFSTGLLTGELESDSFGGLCGLNVGGTISNCFWDTQTSGVSVGQNSSVHYPVQITNLVGKTTIQMETESTFTDAGWDFVTETANGTSQMWQIPTGDGYPVLSSLSGYVPVTLSGNGSKASPYLIHNATELGAIHHYSREAFFRLESDINLAGIKWSAAVIPIFCGSFDGNGHAINNLSVTGGGYLGLFGEISTSDAKVSDLAVVDSNITGWIRSRFLGSLCGKMSSGTINKCYSTGSVIGMDDSGDIGGLCGWNSGTISNCYSTCSITGGIYSEYLGGLCGTNSREIINCYTTGSVTGDKYPGGLCGWNYRTITNCYATGSVSGNEYLGGLCGGNADIINNCFWDTQTSGMVDGVGDQDPDPAGVIGMATTQMQAESTFTNAEWDFDTPVWMICGDDYPKLVWNNPDVDNSGKVDIADIAKMVQNWLAIDCGVCNGSDLTGDGNVNFYDYSVISANWLEEDEISKHVFEIWVETYIDYDDPTTSDDTVYKFEFGITTDITAEKIEVLAPSGKVFEIINSAGTYNSTPNGHIWTAREYDSDSGSYEWYYEEYSNNPASFDAYGDGTYTIAVYYNNGRSHPTTVWFGEPGTTNSIPQPTQKPTITSFAHGDSLTSPVTFAWQLCTDTAASTIRLELENTDTEEEIDFYPPIETTALSAPQPLSTGSWEAVIAFGQYYEFQNSDGIDIFILKLSESDYCFTVE